MSCAGSGGSGSVSDWAGSDTHGCRVGAGWAVQRSSSSTAQLQPHLSPVLCRQLAAAALGAAPWCTAGTDSNAHACSGLRSEQSCFGAERAEQSRAGQKAEQQPGSAVPFSPAAPSAPRWSRAEQSRAPHAQLPTALLPRSTARRPGLPAGRGAEQQHDVPPPPSAPPFAADPLRPPPLCASSPGAAGIALPRAALPRSAPRPSLRADGRQAGAASPPRAEHPAGTAVRSEGC